jgi:murein L,D-transpeptidase YafK
VALLKRPFARALLASAAVVVAVALAGCDTDGISPTGRAQAPLSEKTLAEMASKNMDKDSPILARIYKEEAEMEIWKKNRDGDYALLKTYPICKWSGDLGPKKKEGDRQAPEGFYTITDPPVKALRKVIPPLRLGGVAIDLSFIAVLLICYILLSLNRAVLL